jgi:putative flippase GtrA
LLTAVRHIVLSVIDFFHRPFERMINKQTFRYLACGGSNAVLNILIYWFTFNYVLKKQDLFIGFLQITSHVAALGVAFVITFPLGFILSRYIVFPESALRGRVQLVRYLSLVGICIVLNYIFIKIFVEVCHFYPTLANILTNALVAVFSYVSQRAYTFKVKKAKKA